MKFFNWLCCLGALMINVVIGETMEEKWSRDGLTLLHVMDRTDPNAEPFLGKLWQDYKTGFSNGTSGEFWLGLDKMHDLTKNGSWLLIMEIKYERAKQFGSWSVKSSKLTGQWGKGVWDKFSVGSEAENYKLSIGDSISMSNLGSEDAWEFHRNMQFSAPDRDNDKSTSRRGCAANFRGGWWMNKCFHVCLTCRRTLMGNWHRIVEGEKKQLEIPSISVMWIKKVGE